MLNIPNQIHLILSRQYGLDLYRLFRGLISTWGYIVDYVAMRKEYKGRVTIDPWLHDKSQSAGATANEYFWQDLFVANLIYRKDPEQHADIGSRIDGFIAHLASFRKIEVFDIRANTKEIPNVLFRQADLINFDAHKLNANINRYDSVSCLHALEHFGLGRYGDQINVLGPAIGIGNISKLIKPEGLFYLSVPVGRECINFNANWIFDPNKIIQMAREFELNLIALYELFPDSTPKELAVDERTLITLTNKKYTLCLFIFRKS